MKVWQNDGTVEYGKGGHLVLMIVTGVVVGSILLTYLTVLLAGRPLMKINKVREYLRPIYEAIHAPYGHNKDFFLLFHHSCCFPVSAQLYRHWQQLSSGRLCNRYSSYCYLFHYCCIFRPFKEMYINILSIIIFTVTGIFVGSVWFFYINLIVWPL